MGEKRAEENTDKASRNVLKLLLETIYIKEKSEAIFTFCTQIFLKRGKEVIVALSNFAYF